MGRAKEIILKVIPSKLANIFVKKHHYSGTVVNNSMVHFGCFLDGALHGVMSFGASMDKRKSLTLVSDTGWNEFLELNRMAFDDYLPKNSESRCIAIAFKLIKKQAPHIKWIISYSDATACGDGCIYRASGFLLTGIRKNTGIYEFPDGARYVTMTLTKGSALETRKRLCVKYGAKFSAAASMKCFEAIGARKLEGFQLRYIKIFDPKCKLLVEQLPFSKIGEMGAGMYLGKKMER